MRQNIKQSARQKILWAVLCGLAILWLAVPSAYADETRLQFVPHPESQIVLGEFIVELAQTNEDMRRGLMYRRHLPPQRGMLFIFFQPQKVRFWMRNTMIPLDMIFVKANGEIESIVSRADTESDAPSHSQGKVKYVVELNLGKAREAGLKAGHFMRLPDVR